MKMTLPDKELAEAVGVLLGRITDDAIRVKHVQHGKWAVERWTGSEWVRG